MASNRESTMINEEIYWKLDGGGFYVLYSDTPGYLFVGHEEHMRLINEAALNGMIIVYDADLGKLVTQFPIYPDPDPVEPGNDS